MPNPSGEFRPLLQELYLQDLTLGVYAVYVRRLRDAVGRRILQEYLRNESERRRRIEEYLARKGVHRPSGPGRLFATAGALYGRVTSLFGTRVMLRIVLSASRRASRRACARLGPVERPEIAYLASLRARSEGDLLDALRQHLIDSRPRPS
jgi:demethoxyubiquinone hydroxylase (CLK1/Coq7/Cat5 family)